MFGFKLTAILGLVLLTALGGSFMAVKNMASSRATASTATASATPSPSPIPSPSAVPSITPSPSPSIKPSAKPTAKPSVSPTPQPTPEIIITTTTVTTTTTYTDNPKIDSIDPSNPAFSAPMTIKGKNFGNQAGIINIYNSKGEAQPYPNSTSWSDTEIKTYSPFYASDTEYQIGITTAGGLKSNLITVKSGGGQPQIDSISPSGAKPGDEITITGSRYDNNAGSVNFFLNYPNISGTGNIVSWSDTTIKVKIPANLEAGKEYGIQIINGRGGQSSFKYYILGS